MSSARNTGFPARQRGATLVIALLILVLIMMIGITAVSTSDTQFKLAGNLQFEDSALNNAETAVAAAENWLSNGTNFSNAGFTTDNRLMGSGVGLGKGSSGCNKVNLYQITARGVSARGATKLVQSFYSVLSC